MPDINYSGPLQPEKGGKYGANLNRTPKKSVNTWGKLMMVGCGVFLLLTGAIIALVFWATSGVSSAGNDFIEALNRGELEAAYELTSMGFQQDIDIAAFEEFIKSNPVLYNAESASFSAMGVESDTFGYVRGTVKGTDGQVSPILIDLVNENEEWKVVNINLNPSMIDMVDYDSEY